LIYYLLNLIYWKKKSMFGTNVRNVYICQWTWNDFQIRTLYSTDDMYPKIQRKRGERVYLKHSEKFSKIIFNEIGLRKIIVLVVVCDCFKAFCRILLLVISMSVKVKQLCRPYDFGCFLRFCCALDWFTIKEQSWLKKNLDQHVYVLMDSWFNFVFKKILL